MSFSEAIMAGYEARIRAEHPSAEDKLVMGYAETELYKGHASVDTAQANSMQMLLELLAAEQAKPKAQQNDRVVNAWLRTVEAIGKAMEVRNLKLAERK